MWKTFLALSLCGTLVAGAEEMVGKLVIPPEAHTKESFRTGNFQLWTANSKLILTESSQVPAERLTGFQNRRVKVKVELIPAQPADPGEQAPLQMSPDGTTKLEDHPASYRVLSIQGRALRKSVLICSIDLIGGQAVQLRQGKTHVLTSPEDPIDLATRFNRYGEVAVIDLDAALKQGDNLELLRKLCQVADVRVGGGIRTHERANQLLRAGARQIIVGTAATPEFLEKLPPARVQVALDSIDGKVVDHGWTETTNDSVLERAQRLAPYCSSFLCTFVKEEGGMGGMDLPKIEALAKSLPHPVTVAGGVATGAEVSAISKLGHDVQVGMALYTGALDPVDTVVNSLDFAKANGLIPTIVQDKAGQILTLAYSSPESLNKALTEGKGIYYSRSRKELWEKGATSGHTQKLLACRTDCDRDALLFLVEQTGHACHRESYSCFGSPLPAPRFGLHQLFQTLQQRRSNPPEGSFTAKLFANRKLLKRKIMEEAFEVATFADRRELVWEIADALYFMSALAVDEGISWQEIQDELGGRHR